MEFNQLESFVKCAKYKSFSRAASDLFLSQPSVSLHVSNLESELAVKLFSRENKKLSLTSYGEFFLPLAEEIIAKRNESKTKLFDFVCKMEGSVNLLSSSVPSEVILPDILTAYNKIYQDTSFQIMTCDSEHVCSKILEGKASLGIVGSKFFEDSLYFEKIFDDEIIFVSSKQLAKITALDLYNYNIISRSVGSGTRDAVERSLISAGLDVTKLNNNIIMENNSAIMSLVKDGDWITYMSRAVSAKYLKSGDVFQVEIDDLKINRSFYFVYIKERSLTRTEERFKEFVKKSFS